MTINGLSLSKVDKTKCVGLQIGQHLTWETRLESIIKKVVSSLAVLRKIKKSVKPENLVTIYKSVTTPYFDYCCIVWDGIGSELTKYYRSCNIRNAQRSSKNASVVNTKAKTNRAESNHDV